MHLWIRRREADGEDEASTGTKVEFDPSAISGCKLLQRAAGLPVVDILTTTTLRIAAANRSIPLQSFGRVHPD